MININPNTVAVPLGDRSYNVHIGSGVLSMAAGFVSPFVSPGHHVAFILTDKNAEPYAATLKAALEQSGQCAAVHLLALPPGEETKSMQGYEKTLNWMLERGVTRKSVLFAVGGGVVGDLAGFAAATVLRGIAFIQVPTTLLAMVDSAVGGKTAIDMPQGKNLVGAFHQPHAVLADIDTLGTLPVRQMRAGYAEAVKHAVLGDVAFFEWLEDNGAAVLARDPAAVKAFVEKNCRIKAKIVAADEREGGQRALLNLGHTFGHALEVASGYSDKLLHGEAVAMGMMMAMKLSVRLGHLKEGDCQRVQTHLAKVGLPVDARAIKDSLATNINGLVQLMYADKKADTGSLTFILARGIGTAFVQTGVAESDVVAVLDESIGGVSR